MPAVNSNQSLFWQQALIINQLVSTIGTINNNLDSKLLLQKFKLYKCIHTFTITFSVVIKETPL